MDKWRLGSADPQAMAANLTGAGLGFLVRTASFRYSKSPPSCPVIRHGTYSDLSPIRISAGLHKTSAQRLAGRLKADMYHH